LALDTVAFYIQLQNADPAWLNSSLASFEHDVNAISFKSDENENMSTLSLHATENTALLYKNENPHR